MTRAGGERKGGRMPVIFVAHGAPVLLDDEVWMAELAAWARAMPKPRSILMVSAHWDRTPTTLGATRTVPLVHDFEGFPERFYQTRYPAPGAPELAGHVRELLLEDAIDESDAPERGLDIENRAFRVVFALLLQAAVVFEEFFAVEIGEAGRWNVRACWPSFGPEAGHANPRRGHVKLTSV